MKVNRKKLEVAMAKACMNTEDLRATAKMPRGTLNNAITGRGVSPRTVGIIARTLKIPVEDIIEEEW